MVRPAALAFIVAAGCRARVAGAVVLTGKPEGDAPNGYENPDFPSVRQLTYKSNASRSGGFPWLFWPPARPNRGQGQGGGQGQALQGQQQAQGQADYNPFDGDQNWTSKLLVVPEHKFAFCYIDKVACTQFNLMMNHFNHIDEGYLWGRSSNSQQGVSFSDVTREKGWFRAVFLRDPAERLLSAHQSKCESHEGYVESDGTECEGSTVDGDAPLAERVQRFRQTVESLRGKTRFMRNAHYDPMRYFCGGLSGDLKEFDYVGHLSGGFANVRHQVSEMLERAGLPFDDKVSELFPESRRPLGDYTGHETHMTNAKGSFEDYYAAVPGTGLQSKELVEEFYASDYEMQGVSGLRRRL